MSYKYEYVPRGFFFCSQNVNGDDETVYGFYNVEKSEVTHFLSTSHGLADNFRPCELLLRALGYQAKVGAPTYEQETALHVAASNLENFKNNALSASAKLYYLMCIALSRLGVRVRGGTKLLCEPEGGMNRGRLYDVQSEVLYLNDRQGNFAPVTGGRMFDIALFTAILNYLYPNFMQPSSQWVSGSVFDPYIADGSTNGVAVPFFGATKRVKEHSDGIGEDIASGVVISSTKWNRSSQVWENVDSWVALSACALSELAEVTTSDPLLAEIAQLDVLGFIANACDLINSETATQVGVANQNVVAAQQSLTALSNRWSDARATKFDTAYEATQYTRDKVDNVGSSLQLLSETLAQVSDKVDDVDETVDDVANVIEEKVAALVNRLNARVSLDNSIILALVLKLAITKIRRKRRPSFIATLENLQYISRTAPLCLGDGNGSLNMYLALFDADGKLNEPDIH